MSTKWNEEVFAEFIRLRNTLRAAKRDKNYQLVLSLGLSIIELDKTASFLGIATYIFLKDMAEASIKLGDMNAAIDYLLAAQQKLNEQAEHSAEWQQIINVIDRKLVKLRDKYESLN